ncbi:DUF4864 domain-containing protein [Litorisediminicola beolgyonensis]|uniref:DUF4864 domain-containing protein n=1 Tax=Litorisediminicola beolgyonensis TaxID=1173614 RepID=A0ABW3ZMY0_9RHOB
MRLPLLAVITLLALALPLRAQEVLAPDKGIEGVISNQMAAFAESDLSTAFSFAAPGIQGMFGTPDRFGVMVQQGYPMVWNPGEVRFGRLREIDGLLWQEVFVRDQDGTLHGLDYNMVDLGGAWRIRGVRFLKPEGVAA